MVGRGTAADEPLPSRAPGNLDLDRYRTVVGDLHADLTARPGPLGVEDVVGTVRPALVSMGQTAPWGSAPADLDALIDSLGAEVRRYRPGGPSSAQDVATLARVFLLSQIDSWWWRDVEPFHDADLAGTDDLRDLGKLAQAGRLSFRFKRQPAGLAGRVRDGLVHRVLPGREPHTSGLSQAMARPELVAMLNQIATDFAAAAPKGTPPLWVTSVLRTMEQQHRLRDLGYSALLPSAHCIGYAADVEMRWYARFGAAEALSTVLLDLQERRLVNVVDEGQAWHVCLSPLGRNEMRSSCAG